jgi:alpha-methylacyl-CoA racemase
MLLADLGADVIRVDRKDPSGMFAASSQPFDVLARGRRSIAVDLKHPEGAEVVLRLVERADAMFEGMRPGVAERLGIGPDACLARNPALVYGRMTGWGQEGPWAGMSGHDIDYIALTGMLDAIGPRGGAPVPPLNLVGDFGGGGLMLAFGLLAGILHARATGEGQVVDAAMVDGAATLGAMIFGLRAAGQWSGGRGENLLDGGAPFYGVYETSDGGHMAVGALEPQFYAALLEGLGFPAEDASDQWTTPLWQATRERFAARFRSRTRHEWTEVFVGTDACVAPILSMGEVADHPHMAARGTIVEVDGIAQPAPAPRFSRTSSDLPEAPRAPGSATRDVLEWAGFTVDEQAHLVEVGVL